MTSTIPQSVVILGRDPAGLVAALALTRHGYRVTVINCPLSIGGASTTNALPDTLEPLIILGCHRSTRFWLHSLGTGPQQPPQSGLPLEFQLLDNSLVHYPRTSVPAPLHTWINLLKFAGIPWKDRWHGSRRRTAT